MTHLAGCPKQRTFVRLHGVGHVLRVGVHNNSLPNITRALRERVFAVEGPNGLQPTPQPAKDAFGRLSEFRSQLLPRLGHCLPKTLREFLEHYRGAKLTRYTQAVEDLEVLGVHRKDAFLKAFVKGEFVNLDAKGDPAPRIIQPRSPKYNAAVGRFIQPLERRVYRAIKAVFGDHTVMKGFNALEVGAIAARKFGKFKKPVCVGLDASRFDQHVSEQALRWEHSIYLNATPVAYRKELAGLLEWQIDNVGTAYLPEATVKYKVRGCRMSGDMNTALGNCLLMCAMVWTYARSKGITVELMNNGDDCQVIMEKENLPTFSDGLKEWFLELGFTMKVEEPREVLEQMEFCQTRPVCVDGTWVMCRNPSVAISKDTTWKTPTSSEQPDHYREWMAGVGECGLSLSGGMPIMQEFYASLIRNGLSSAKNRGGPKDVASGFAAMARGMSRAYQPVAATTRYSFWLAWGIVPDSQEAAEHRYRNMACPRQMRPMIDYQSIERDDPLTVFECI